MKNKILAFACMLLAALVPVASLAAPKKKSGKSDITSADEWTKKASKFDGKTVKTLVIDIGDAGQVMSDAAAAVIPITTGDKNQDAAGDILVVLSLDDFSSFVDKFAPGEGGGSSSFGGRIAYRELSGTFAKLGEDYVLLYNVKADDLKNFNPSEAHEKQLGSSEEAEPVKPGYKRKKFPMSKLGKKPYTQAEFKRLVGLYNKAQKEKSERLTEREVKKLLKEDGASLTVLDDKNKIQWKLCK